jgi:hypothetical protein
MKLRSKMTFAGASLLAIAFAGIRARANSLPGTIDIQGNAVTQNAAGTAKDNLAVATQYVSITALVDASGDTGAFAAIPNDTPVTFTPFAFDATSVAPLWSLTTGAGTYVYNTTSVALDYQNAGFINLSGVGSVSLNGTDNTPGTWSLTDTIQAGTVTFSYVSTQKVPTVPEGGNTMLLVGLSLLGVAAFSLIRSRKSAVA